MEKPQRGGGTSQHTLKIIPCNQPAITVFTHAKLHCTTNTATLCSLRGFIVMAFGLVSLGLHCFLQLSSAGLIDVLVPGCCWAYSAFSA